MLPEHRRRRGAQGAGLQCSHGNTAYGNVGFVKFCKKLQMSSISTARTNVLRFTSAARGRGGVASREVTAEQSRSGGSCADSWSVMNKELIRILIVDDHAVVREGLKHVISRQIDMIVAGEASTRAEALKLLDEQRFDVVVCDVKLPDGQGWDVLKAVKSGPQAVAVLMLSAFTEEQFAVQALKSGADGYVNKGSAAETLISAIRRLASGGKFVSPEFAAHVAQVLGHGDPAAHEALSEREFAVMRMIASGNSLVSIAQNLNISPKTVTTYRARVLEKLGLENNAALTRYVLEKGLLD